ncbi:DNA helicase-2/ATP-dependent DNA helicase PcrA [Symbiobacterium terraclitae]|uniref:DNA 3'-5' helicase n=2 Tax=Symbiobacterium terraclitae TaxID=557451 RepID=A0ABS4JNB2_9FIRM|nr:ATP-dependent helicase [Symbiobacterium terraclitae]MBP2017030.1 DNA helicase-2/ATP-dependent DNA helicase PcrA [Symbiobacterium terraclitae]
MSLTLRPDQARVAEYRGGYMAVPAVPGAGKTTVLAYLAADLIAAGLPAPGRVLVVTYTNSAVGNFKSRIGGFLEARGLPRTGYEVRTIHSLAVQIVRQRPEAIGWPDTFAVVDEVRRGAILSALTRRWIAGNREAWEALVRAGEERRQDALGQWDERTQSLMGRLIQSFKARRLSPEDALALTRALPEHLPLRWAAEVYQEYQRALAREGLADFDDLMLGAYRLLKGEPDLLERMQRRWTYIFEDEAQDSYRLQEQVLRLLAGPSGNLVRVGDANQAIMGSFTTAEPDLFRRFGREPGVAVRPLTMAGRSSREIIGLANELVRWTREEHPDPGCRDALEAQWIEPVPPGGGQSNPEPGGRRVLFRAFDSYRGELEGLARMAARSVREYPDATVGVLLPTNAMVDELLAELRALGAPAEAVGRTAPMERLRLASDLLAALAFLAAPHMSERREAVPGFEPYLDGWLEAACLPADELLLRMASDLRLTGADLALAQYLALRARRLLEEEPLYGLADVARELAEGLKTSGWLAEALYDRRGFEPVPGVVYVTTCHSSKGLEWDTVYVGGLTRAQFPGALTDWTPAELWFLPEDHANPEAAAVALLDRLVAAATGGGAPERSVDSPVDGPHDDPVARAKREHIAERLRLLYVAITRARCNLLLSFHRENQRGRKALPTPALVHLSQFAAKAR